MELKYAFSNKSDGNMSYLWGEKDAVLQNRTRFFQKNNLGPDQAVMMHVIYGDQFAEIAKADLKKGIYDLDSAPKVDAFITKEPNITLCLLTADCLPIIFYDLSQNVLALAHLGWQGTNLKLSQKVIRTLIEKYSCNPQDIKVIIGPGIHKESYILKKPIAQQSNPDWQPYLKAQGNDKISIDLTGYNTRQIKTLGITSIEVTPQDTFQDMNQYSHLRSVQTDETEGRFMTIATLKK